MGFWISRILFLLGLVSATGGCTSLMYHPSQQIFVDPRKWELTLNEVEFKTSDGLKLKGWFFPAQVKAPGHVKGTVVQFHGNAENRSSHFLSLIWIVEEGYNLLSFDYRGYGGSEGTPSQEGLYLDGMAAIRYAKQNVPPLTKADLILYGQSLGSAILARCFEDVTDRSRILSVVLEGSFYSYQSIAQDVLSRRFFTWPFQWLGVAWISDQYSPEDSFRLISPTPLLVIHGDKDPVVPIRFGEEVFGRAAEPKRFLKIPGGRHLNTFHIKGTDYRTQVLEYWEGLKR